MGIFGLVVLSVTLCRTSLPGPEGSIHHRNLLSRLTGQALKDV
jgi:hypothetical protein